MIRKIITAAVFSSFLAGPAWAFHCPSDMRKIDAALHSTHLTGADLARVKELRATGEKQHKAGRHSASVATLAKAMALLGIN